MTENQIEPALFDLLDEYSNAIASGDLKSERAIARSSKAITFLQSFFEQFFASTFDIQLEAFDDESKRMSVALRHERDIPRLLRPLISAFEELCDLYPDVIGASYGGGSTATFRRFHKRYLPRLLRASHRWAAESDQEDLEKRIQMSITSFNDALGVAKW